ncbi:MAG: T9SS type A sorting domain-containing protein [Aureispira sp.]
MKQIFAFAIILGCCWSLTAQTITNGTFDSRRTGWGCNPEAVHRETTYGGTDRNNIVAEVDASAGLCQSVAGFIVGQDYALSFRCSRRTTCGPALQSMSLVIDGGALSVNVSRNGGGFNFSDETFVFTATSTSHQIEWDGTSPGTCGLIVDNIGIAEVMPLPIELAYFDAAVANKNQVVLSWETAVEINNSHFTIEHSMDGVNWEAVTTVAGAGNSNVPISYRIVDELPHFGISYYRLKQTDFDGQYTYSEIKAVEIEIPTTHNITVYPNPTRNIITVDGLPLEYGQQLELFNALGQAIPVQIQSQNERQVIIDLSNLQEGMYLLKTGTTVKQIYKQ